MARTWEVDSKTLIGDIAYVTLKEVETGVICVEKLNINRDDFKTEIYDMLKNKAASERKAASNLQTKQDDLDAAVDDIDFTNFESDIEKVE